MRRDRLTFVMIFGLPIIQILLFGYAINTDVRNLKTAVANHANTHLSRPSMLISLSAVHGMCCKERVVDD